MCQCHGVIFGNDAALEMSDSMGFTLTASINICSSHKECDRGNFHTGVKCYAKNQMQK